MTSEQTRLDCEERLASALVEFLWYYLEPGPQQAERLKKLEDQHEQLHPASVDR